MEEKLGIHLPTHLCIALSWQSKKPVVICARAIHPFFDDGASAAWLGIQGDSELLIIFSRERGDTSFPSLFAFLQ